MLFQPYPPLPRLFPLPFSTCTASFRCLFLGKALLIDPPSRGGRSLLWGPVFVSFPLDQHRARTGPQAQSLHHVPTTLPGPYPRQIAAGPETHTPRSDTEQAQHVCCMMAEEMTWGPEDPSLLPLCDLGQFMQPL